MTLELDDEVESTLWNEKLYSAAGKYIYVFFSPNQRIQTE